MVYLNDNAKEYMQKYGWRHVCGRDYQLMCASVPGGFGKFYR